MTTLVGRRRALLLVTASRVAAALATFLITLVAARAFPQRTFGVFAFFSGTATLVSAICDIGVSMRLITTYRSSNSGGWTDPTLRAYWSAQVLSYGGGAVLATMVALLTPLPSYLHAPPYVLVCAGVAGAAGGLFTFLSAGFTAQSLWGKLSVVTLIQVAVRAAMTLPGILIRSLPAACAGYALGTCFAVPITLAVYRRQAGPGSDFAGLVVSPREAVRVWKESRWYAVSGSLGPVAAYAPLAFADRLGDPVQLAYFGLAMTLSTAPALLLNSSMTVLLPGGSNPEVPWASYKRTIAEIVGPVLGMLVVVLVAAPIAIPFVFGDRYGGSVPPFQLMVIGTMVLVLANPLQFLHYRLGHARFLTLVDLVTLIATLVVIPISENYMTGAAACALGVMVAAFASRAVGLGGLIPIWHRLTDVS